MSARCNTNGDFSFDYSVLAGFNDATRNVFESKHDTAFAELKVWQDKNSDGISQANKWIKIDFKKIKSLKLAA